MPDVVDVEVALDEAVMGAEAVAVQERLCVDVKEAENLADTVPLGDKDGAEDVLGDADGLRDKDGAEDILGDADGLGDKDGAEDVLDDADGVGAGEHARGKIPDKIHPRLETSFENLAVDPSKPGPQLKEYKSEFAFGTDGFEIVLTKDIGG